MRDRRRQNSAAIGAMRDEKYAIDNAFISRRRRSKQFLDTSLLSRFQYDINTGARMNATLTRAAEYYRRQQAFGLPRRCLIIGRSGGLFPGECASH